MLRRELSWVCWPASLLVPSCLKLNVVHAWFGTCFPSRISVSLALFECPSAAAGLPVSSAEKHPHTVARCCHASLYAYVASRWWIWWEPDLVQKVLLLTSASDLFFKSTLIKGRNQMMHCCPWALSMLHFSHTPVDGIENTSFLFYSLFCFCFPLSEPSKLQMSKARIALVQGALFCFP